MNRTLECKPRALRANPKRGPAVPARAASRAPRRAATLTALAALSAAMLVCMQVRAEVSASSAASNSASASVGSLSTSLENSSNSSSRGDRTAAGPYRVVEIAEAPADPSRVRVLLAAVPGKGGDGEFYLTLPRAAADGARLATGDVVAANRRPYGIEFARFDDGRSFFLAMADEWYRELRTQAVTL